MNTTVMKIIRMMISSRLEDRCSIVDSNRHRFSSKIQLKSADYRKTNQYSRPTTRGDQPIIPTASSPTEFTNSQTLILIKLTLTEPFTTE